MHPTNCITVFLRHNDSELRLMFSHICAKLRFAGSHEDLVQDFYVRLINSDILQKYNRHFTTSKSYTTCRLSSYLYPIMKNFVIGVIQSSEYKYTTNRVSDYDPETREFMEFDGSCSKRYCYGYQDIIDYNDSSDNCDGPRTELKYFYESFKNTKQDKVIARKQCQEKGLPKASLSRLFVLLYEGYTNKEIAKNFGVSAMYITLMKQQLANRMMKYGFHPIRGKKNGSSKMSEVSFQN